MQHSTTPTTVRAQHTSRPLLCMLSGTCSALMNPAYDPDLKNDQYIQSPEGLPCPDGARQCGGGVCTAPKNLNKFIIWEQGLWSNCYTCDEMQHSKITCMQIRPDGKTVV